MRVKALTLVFVVGNRDWLVAILASFLGSHGRLGCHFVFSHVFFYLDDSHAPTCRDEIKTPNKNLEMRPRAHEVQHPTRSNASDLAFGRGRLAAICES